MLQEHYPNRLCYFRKRSHLSQKQLAALIGQHDRTMISKYERGAVTPQFEVAGKFQILFGVNTADIFPEDFKNWENDVGQAKFALQRSVHFEENHP